MGRPARGVRGMDLEEGDYLVGVEVVGKDGLILSISENGYGKRTPLEDYRLTARGRKGVINMKTTPRVGKVVGDSFGEGRFRPDDHHQAGPDHPHRFGRDPPGRPLHARRPPGERRSRRSGGRGESDSGGGGTCRGQRAGRSAAAIEAFVAHALACSDELQFVVSCYVGQAVPPAFRHVNSYPPRRSKAPTPKRR